MQNSIAQWPISKNDKSPARDNDQRLGESLKIPIYFTDPGSPYQPGRNGNANGLLREFFPKATDFSEVSEDERLAALLKINNRPRKCLCWKTPIEIFQHEVVHLI